MLETYFAKEKSPDKKSDHNTSQLKLKWCLISLRLIARNISVRLGTSSVVSMFKPSHENLLWNEMFPTHIMTALSWINSIIDKNRCLRHRKWFVYLKCFIFYSLFEVRASSRKEEVTLHLTPQDIYGHNGVSAWTWQHLRRAKNILQVADVSLWESRMSSGSSLTCRRCEYVLVGDYLIDKDVQIWHLKQLNKQNKFHEFVKLKYFTQIRYILHICKTIDSTLL